MGKKKNKNLITALILFISVSLIPLIYSTTYLASVWDVYGHTDKLPVAVVNLDKGDKYKGKEVNFGDKLVERLKESDRLDFSFVSKEAAKLGLEKENKYYATITIPENFSKELASATTFNKTKATIEYSANEKKNYVASMILKSAMASLKDSIKSEEAKQITASLVDNLNNVPKSLETLNNGVTELKNGSDKIVSGNEEILSGSNKIKENLYNLSEGMTKLSNGSSELLNGTKSLPLLLEGVGKLNASGSELAKNLNLANEGTKKLDEANLKINAGLKELDEKTANLGELSNAVNLLSNGSSNLDNGIKEVAKGSNALSVGSDRLVLVSGMLSVGGEQLNSGIERISTSLNVLNDKIQAQKDEVSNGINAQIEPIINSSIKNLSNGIDTSFNKAIEDSKTEINGNLERILNDQNLETKNKILEVVNESFNEYKNNVGNYINSVDGYLTYPSTINDYTTKVSEYTKKSKELSDAVTAKDMQRAEVLAGELKLLSADLDNETTKVKDNSTLLINSKNKIDDETQKIKDYILSVENNLSNVLVGANENLKNEIILSITNTLEKNLSLPLKDSIVNGVKKEINENLMPHLQSGISTGFDTLLKNISNGISKIQVGINGINNSGYIDENKLNPSLLNGSKMVNSGINMLNTGLLEFNKNFNTLNDGINNKILPGSNKLTESLVNLDEKTKNLGQINLGIQKLYAGSNEFSTGLSSLSKNMNLLSLGANNLSSSLELFSKKSENLEKLSDGIVKLNDGINVANAGSNKLYEGSNTLNAALLSLQDGNEKLNNGLEKLSDGITSSIESTNEKLKLTDGLAEYAGDGIEIITNPFDEVKNYGESFAPYFFNVSLWTGSLILMMTIYFDYKRRLTVFGPESKRPLVRFFTFIGISVAQGVLVGLAAQTILGLSPNMPITYYLGLISIALTYSWIMEFLMMVVGDLGKMLSMILMVFQLTATGGTFPTQLNPPLFQILNPMLPMTYGIQLMKEAVSGYSISYSLKNMFILLTYGFVSILFLFIYRLFKNKKENEKISKEISVE